MESLKFSTGKLLMICLAIPVIAVIAIMVFKISVGNLFFFAILAACPLMHVFMMKGHGNHDKANGDKKSSKTCH